jgi:hypothetical protein
VAAPEERASYRRSAQRASGAWLDFQAKRRELLAPVDRYGRGAEKLAEDVVRLFLTTVVGWSDTELNPQIDRADLVITQLGLKRLLIEVKHPGSLAWNEWAAKQARLQARGYAEKQRVNCVAVSNAFVFHAVDLTGDKDLDRFFCDLTRRDPPEDPWWIGPDGITEKRPFVEACRFRTLESLASSELPPPPGDGDGLLHPRYKVPAACFAYVEQVDDPTSWHLPYLHGDGSIDVARLPKAIRAVLKNYRGVRVKTVPEKAIPDVLVCLGHAAAAAGKIARDRPPASPVYGELVAALDQLQRLDEVFTR